jgi:hypothetical protein
MDMLWAILEIAPATNPYSTSIPIQERNQNDRELLQRQHTKYSLDIKIWRVSAW